jgi:hypothetical protein
MGLCVMQLLAKKHNGTGEINDSSPFFKKKKKIVIYGVPPAVLQATPKGTRTPI